MAATQVPGSFAAELRERVAAERTWDGHFSVIGSLLIKFLADAFGFEETVVYGEGDLVHHAELAWPHPR